MKFGKVTGDCKCPVCEKQLNGFADPNGNGNSPVSGDLTVCVYCQSFLQFMDDGMRVAPDRIVKQLIESDMNVVTKLVAEVRKEVVQ